MSDYNVPNGVRILKIKPVDRNAIDKLFANLERICTPREKKLVREARNIDKGCVIEETNGEPNP